MWWWVCSRAALAWNWAFGSLGLKIVALNFNHFLTPSFLPASPGLWNALATSGAEERSTLGKFSLNIYFYSRHGPQVEVDSACRAVIQTRILDGLADPAPIHNDITTLEPESLPENLDGFCLGFPCQAGLHSPVTTSKPFIPANCEGISRAGSQRGLLDGRSMLVSHAWRLWDGRKRMKKPMILASNGDHETQ